MTKIATLIAVAALGVAGSAHADSITVSLAGKSPAQAKADITIAAKRVCRAATTNASFRHIALASCVEDTLATTLAKVEPTFAGEIQMASR